MSKSHDSARGDLQTALKNATELLTHDARLAQEQALEILKVYPDTMKARRILAAALRLQKLPEKALDTLKPMLAEFRDSPDFLHEIAQCYGAVGRGDDAVHALRRATDLDPGHALAWQSLGHQLKVAGNEEGSRQAFEQHFKLSTQHPELVEAVELLRDGKLGKAERIVRDLLKEYPLDVSAMRVLADIGLKMGQLKDACHLLERCLELAPDFHAARHSYAMVLVRQQKAEAALREAEILLAQEPNNPNFLTLKGSILVRIGDHEQALDIYERVLENYPNQARAQMSYGHTLKTVGRLAESIEAYRKCIRLSPEVGEAYWSLANLKTFSFDEEDIEHMRDQVTAEGGDADDQAHLAFALGKALEDRGEYDESFKFYRRGNAIRRIEHRHNPKVNVLEAVRQVRTLDKGFFEQREGWGCDAPDPIFIVGLPRAGSTLLEQILASHSKVEGTSELQDIIAISREIAGKCRENPSGKYPENLVQLTAERFRELGESYLRTTRIQRGDSPFFIDKMPNNFRHIGLIHLILPNSKIIDARRHPMGCCFSGFKQLFANGQTFTYDLQHIGKYYRDYVRLMDHWDAVLPGRVHRVQYEEMVADTETQIRALLDYCGLEFEEQCLRFYETERAVRTPSSEQVRKPIYTDAMEQWRNFEEHLDPLKDALGAEVRQRYSVEP
ncbi:MAG: sulfotransferase [Gammaproteobacteria bacterium]|nr:sulfotransferase [Gammaproteobacteria bacterium]NNK99397.1 tetratricopeptide repeat protein [Xanthomonadales bacterium]